jgi:hypothetical protein
MVNFIYYFGINLCIVGERIYYLGMKLTNYGNDLFYWRKK